MKPTNKHKPPFRRLRGYAFDPSLSVQLDLADINNLVYNVKWEDVAPGPVGEYLEVIDYDPSSKCFYAPVDLNEEYILAQDGLDPAESNPQFHQQMVYAVAMNTIKNFEAALGRKISWSSYRPKEGPDEYVQRLRIYPHAMRDANAYYSPQKKSLLFGYFSAAPDNAALAMPGATVYTCLSHDIIAHETTHAILDGMHRRYIEATHPDSLAFHEAFADIVALFQHFKFADVLKAQIAQTRGDLRSQNLLGELAQQFGKAIGHYGSLRDAIGEFNDNTEKWEPHKPDPADYSNTDEPHARGAILVATIFDAFLNIYKRRVADLLRIATGGNGNLSLGELHPDLVNRMANEASKTAGHILSMCIRALDYCPPMDINFGDYLRALITADYDLLENDDREYRLAIIEAFQRRGIFPEEVKNMSVESLLCRVEEQQNSENMCSDGSTDDRLDKIYHKLIDFFKKFKEKISYVNDRAEIHRLTRIFIAGGEIGISENGTPEKIMGLHQRLNIKIMGKEIVGDFSWLTGLILEDRFVKEKGIGRSTARNTQGMPKIEIHNLKLASRVGPNGNIVNQIVLTITQKRGVVGSTDKYGNVSIEGFFNADDMEDGWYKRTGNKEADYVYIKMPFEGNEEGLTGKGSEKVLPKGWFVFRGGSTLIFDLDYNISKDGVKLKYVIRKNINSEERMKRQFNMLFGKPDFSLNATYFGKTEGNLEAEPFAMIHKIL